MKKLSLLALSLASAGAFAQFTVSDFTTGYTQNFDSLIASNPVTAIALPPGTAAFPTAAFGGGNTNQEWAYGRGTATSSPAGVFTTNDGTGSSGGFFSAGTGSNTERALGVLGTGTFGLTNSIGLALKNNATATGLVTLDFALEQWRLGQTAAATRDRLNLSWRLYKAGVDTYTPGDLNSTTGWNTTNIQQQTTTDNYVTLTSEVATNQFNAPLNTGTPGALDGNLAANRVNFRANIQLFGAGATWAADDVLVIRFTEFDRAPGADDLLALDDVRVVPEPASMLAIGVGIAGLVARRRKNSK